MYTFTVCILRAWQVNSDGNIDEMTCDTHTTDADIFLYIIRTYKYKKQGEKDNIDRYQTATGHRKYRCASADDKYVSR